MIVDELDVHSDRTFVLDREFFDEVVLVFVLVVARAEVDVHVLRDLRDHHRSRAESEPGEHDLAPGRLLEPLTEVSRKRLRQNRPRHGDRELRRLLRGRVGAGWTCARSESERFTGYLDFLRRGFGLLASMVTIRTGAVIVFM